MSEQYFFVPKLGEEKRRRNALIVLWCYKSTNLTPLALMQLMMDLPPLHHGELTF